MGTVFSLEVQYGSGDWDWTAQEFLHALSQRNAAVKIDKKTLRLRRFDKVRREAENLGKQEEQKEKFAAIADTLHQLQIGDRLMRGTEEVYRVVYQGSDGIVLTGKNGTVVIPEGVMPLDDSGIGDMLGDGSITVGKRDNGLERTGTDDNGQNTAPTDADDDIWDDDEMSDVPFQPKRTVSDEERITEGIALQNMQDNLNKVLDDYAAGKIQKGREFEIGGTSGAMKLAGIADYPIVFNTALVDKARDKHGLSDAELRQIPDALYNPVMIFESSDRSSNFENGFVVLTMIHDRENRPVTIALNVSTARHQHIVNAISSMYGRPFGQIKSWINDGFLRYSHKKRALALARFHRLQLPRRATVSERNSHIIIDESENVKPISEKNSIKNQGTPADARGAFDPVTETLHLFEFSDVSTFSHETMHFFLYRLRALRDGGFLKGSELENDLAALEKFATDENGTYDEEKIAKAWEKYIMTGETSNAELKGVFRAFRRWLVDLYQDFKNYFKHVPLTGEVKEIFDRWTASDLESDSAVGDNDLVRLALGFGKGNLNSAEREALSDLVFNQKEAVFDEVDRVKAKERERIRARAVANAKDFCQKDEIFQDSRTRSMTSTHWTSASASSAAR